LEEEESEKVKAGIIGAEEDEEFTDKVEEEA